MTPEVTIILHHKQAPIKLTSSGQRETVSYPVQENGIDCQKTVLGVTCNTSEILIHFDTEEDTGMRVRKIQVHPNCKHLLILFIFNQII